MATTQQFRPAPTGNPQVDEALRQAFDLIYQLQNQVQALQQQAGNNNS